jgi:hypothetical protein
VALAYLMLFRRFVSMEPDEGIVLQGAERVLRGEVPYRDFFSYLTPGSFHLLALQFTIFGNTMLVARTALAFEGALFSVFAYLMARRVCSRWAALAAAYLVAIAGVPWRFNVLHNWDSTLWACAAVYCAMRFIEAPGSAWALGAGSFVSLTILFEQSKGAGLALGLVLGIVLITWLDRRGVRAFGAHGFALCAGLAWPFVLTFVYFGAHHALGALLADWFWPLHHYLGANRVPYGYQDWSGQTRAVLFHTGSWFWRGLALFVISPSFLQPVLPLIAIILLVYWTFEARKGGLAPDRAAYYILMCSSMAGLLLSVVAVTANVIHFVYLAPFFYLVLAWVMDGNDIGDGIVIAVRPLITLFVLITFTVVGLALLVTHRDSHWPLDTRRGWVNASGPDNVVPYVQSHLIPGSKMLVHPYLPLYNYLTGTCSPIRYDYLQPGMNTREQDEEAIQELAADRTPVVLFEIGFNEKIATAWPNTPLQFVANDLVGDYILGHYRPCRILRSSAGEPLVFLVRKDLKCP